MEVLFSVAPGPNSLSKKGMVGGGGRRNTTGGNAGSSI